MKAKGKKVLSTVIAAQLALGTVWGGSAVFADGTEADGLQTNYAMNKIGSYSVGTHNEDGGVAEIVKFNKENGKFYLVNGSTNPPSLDIVELGSADGELKKTGTVLVKDLAETNGFTFGDLTSVAISNENDLVYVAVQEADPHKAGKILALSYDGELVDEYAAGIQPDMIIVTSDGKYVLTADEAEHRTGVKNEDPYGSVTIVNTADGKSEQLYFDNPAVIADDVHIRSQANADGVVDGEGTKADAIFDFEPEYITLSSDNGTAYVTLQENNAIATVDIAKAEITSVKSLGLKDYNDPANALDIRKDDQFMLENVPFYGVYMPDGIASYEVDGKTYLLTANEGDATEWPDRVNASTVADMKGALNPDSELYKFLQATTDYDDVEVMTDRGHDGIYMYGGRSFSIWNADSMEQVYDSGSDFEKITALAVPDYFNTSNSKAKFDDRSEKKGPEPEDIKTGKIGDQTFAFIGLERVGGIMMYDVTDPTAPAFENYVNTREFADAEGEVILDTDTGPEGIEFIPAADSPTGNPLLLVAYEVGGKVSVLEITEEAPETGVSFNDIDGSYAEQEILAMAQAGLLLGTGDNKFEPKKGMSRADFTLLLSRLAGADLEAGVAATSFTDVEASDYYAAAVEWAAELGIVEGKGNGEFQPKAGITREQMATMIVRFATAMGVELPKLNDAVVFTDEATIGDYAKEAVSAAQQAGILNGKPNADGNGVSFDPLGLATREQTAKMLANVYNQLLAMV